MYREFEMPSNRWRPLVLALAGVLIMLSMTIGRPSSAAAVTSLASDAFGRTVATGWGNLDSGQAWLITNGNDASTDVNASVGQMTHSAVGPLVSELKARVPTFNAKDVDVQATFRAETAANDAPTSNTEFMLYARYDAEQASFCCYYKLTLGFVVGSASPVLRVDKMHGATFTADLGHANLPTTNNDPTVAWNVKLETVGTAVRGKAWLASTSEPGAWQIDINDTTNPVTGVGQDDQFVVGTFTNDITPAMVIDVDDVLVTTAAGSPPDTTPPTVTVKSPLPNATNVSVSTNVTATFSEAVTGVSTGTFAISKSPYTVNLPAAVSYNGGSKTATLNPNANLLPGTKYRVALSGGIKDTAGNPLAWTTWYFTTASSPPALVTFKQGTHTGYQFNASGALTASKTFTLTANSGAQSTTRQAITNQSGMWLLISSGVWTGYWVRESSTTYLTASPIPLPAGSNAIFSPAKLLTILKGTHTGYQFTGSGALTASKTFTLTANSGAQTTARSTRTNQYGKWFLVSSGVWAGYWVLSSDVIHL